MKDVIIERIQELAREITDLLEEREKLTKRIRGINDGIVSKQGAIIEFKGVIESFEPLPESNQDKP